MYWVFITFVLLSIILDVEDGVLDGRKICMIFDLAFVLRFDFYWVFIKFVIVVKCS